MSERRRVALVLQFETDLERDRLQAIADKLMGLLHLDAVAHPVAAVVIETELEGLDGVG